MKYEYCIDKCLYLKEDECVQQGVTDHYIPSWWTKANHPKKKYLQ